MTTIQYNLGGGATIALPIDIAVKQLIEQLQTEAKATIQRPHYQIGEYLPGQGGIYAGPHFEDGKLVHLIAAPESIGERKWEAGKTAAAEYRGAGFDDWFMPEKSHLMIAQIYIKDRFEKAFHWSATPVGSTGAWYVYFEDGNVYVSYRGFEFLVRPFRRFTY